MWVGGNGKDQGGLEKDVGKLGEVGCGLGTKQQGRGEDSWEA